MNITISGKQLEITDGIRAHIEEKIKKTLQRLPEIPNSIHVVLSVEHKAHICQIDFHSNGHDYHSRTEHDDMYQSIDSATQKVGEQAERQRAKKNQHR